MILQQEITEGNPQEFASKFINEEKEVRTVEEALKGAMDIVAETISDDAEVRKQIREATFKTGLLESSVKQAEERTPYEMYYDYSEPVNSIPPHRILAINRGENEGVLKVSIDVDNQKMIGLIEELYLKIQNPFLLNIYAPLLPIVFNASFFLLSSVKSEVL